MRSVRLAGREPVIGAGSVQYVDVLMLAGEYQVANMTVLKELAAQGKLKPRISHRFRLDQAAEALQAVIDRRVIGKAVRVG